MNKWEVFVALTGRQESLIETYDIETYDEDENSARQTYEAYVGSDCTCMLTNNGKLIAVYPSKGIHSRKSYNESR